MNASGTHWTADLGGCDPDHPWMTQALALRDACREAVAHAGLTAVNDCFHAFPVLAGHTTAGITGVVLLAESHLAVHTWPELGVVTLDVFVCNLADDNSARARQLLDALVRGFAPQRHKLQMIRREIPAADRT